MGKFYKMPAITKSAEDPEFPERSKDSLESRAILPAERGILPKSIDE